MALRVNSLRSSTAALGAGERDPIIAPPRAGVREGGGVGWLLYDADANDAAELSEASDLGSLAAELVLDDRVPSAPPEASDEFQYGEVTLRGTGAAARSRSSPFRSLPFRIDLGATVSATAERADRGDSRP